MAEVADDREVVGDEQIRQPQFPLELLQQVDDLRPDRHVERADRLVGDDHRGVERERPRQRPPAGAARRTARAGNAGRVTGDSPTTSSSSRTRWLPLGAGPDVVDAERLGDARAGPPLRVERRRRVLEDHLELGPLRPVPAVLRVQRRPRNRIVPDVGGMSPTMARPSVVLPLPDSPTSPTVSAAASPREMPSTACTCPTVRRNTVPRVIGKCTRRSRTSSSAGSLAGAGPRGGGLGHAVSSATGPYPGGGGAGRNPGRRGSPASTSPGATGL